MSRSLRQMGTRLDAWLVRPSPGAAGRLGLFRIGFAAFYLWYTAWIDEGDCAALSGSLDRFLWLSWFWPQPLPEPLLQATAGVLVAALVLLGAGLQTRAATWVTLIAGAALETMHARIDYSRSAIFLCAFIPLAMLPGCPWGDTFSLDALRARRRGARPVDPNDGGPRYVLPGRAIHLLLAGMFATAALIKAAGVWLVHPGIFGEILKYKIAVAAMWRLPVWSLGEVIVQNHVATAALGVSVLAFEGTFFLSLLPRFLPLYVAIALIFHAVNALWLVVTFTPVLIIYGLLAWWPKRFASRVAAAPRRSLSWAMAATVLAAAALALFWHRAEVRSLITLAGQVDQRTLWYPVLVLALARLPGAVLQASRSDR